MNHKFVEYIPKVLDDEVVYISIKFSTAVHNCVCGCGNEVVTPISPTDWSLIYDGSTISLDPSIGNWSFDCQSHYWIIKGDIIYCEKWSKKEIKDGRKRDLKEKKQYYRKR